MPRSTAASLLALLRSTSSAEVVWLIEIPTGLASPSVLRYTTGAVSVTWNSVLWTPLPAAPPSQQFDAPGSTSGKVLAVGDADGTINGHVEAGALFEGQTVVLHLVDMSQTGGAGANSIPDEYVIESVTRGEGYVNFTLRDLFGSLDKKIPALKTTRALFPGLAPGPLVLLLLCLLPLFVAALGRPHALGAHAIATTAARIRPDHRSNVTIRAECGGDGRLQGRSPRAAASGFSGDAALPANARAVTLGDQVVAREGVSALAVRLPRVDRRGVERPSLDVLRERHDAEVIGPNARRVIACVVQSHAIRNRSVHLLVREAVCHDGLPAIGRADPEVAVAPRVALTTPQPAARPLPNEACEASRGVNRRPSDVRHAFHFTTGPLT